MTNKVLTITFCTNYNGVYVSADGEHNEEDYRILDEANDDMELAGLTYEMCSGLNCFDDPDLTDKQIEELKDVVRNNTAIKDLYGKFTVEFEYDNSST